LQYNNDEDVVVVERTLVLHYHPSCITIVNWWRQVQAYLAAGINLM
jgi:hypothetical protein